VTGACHAGGRDLDRLLACGRALRIESFTDRMILLRADRD
jgi:hypothetical protein